MHPRSGPRTHLASRGPNFELRGAGLCRGGLKAYLAWGFDDVSLGVEGCEGLETNWGAWEFGERFAGVRDLGLQPAAFGLRLLGVKREDYFLHVGVVEC